MIFLFTDFGATGPYIGQMEAVLRRAAPEVPVINLFANVPAFDVQGAAYLLAAYTADVVPGDVVLSIVDPGVGTSREAIVMRADDRWFVGPENGLMAIVARCAQRCDLWRIRWRPQQLSASFHGRDLFAPVAAELGRGVLSAAAERLAAADVNSVLRPAWPDDHAAIISFDHYGNAVTGLRASAVKSGASLKCAGHTITPAEIFGSVPRGTPFWYVNSSGLVEIAANQASVQQVLGLEQGALVQV